MKLAFVGTGYVGLVSGTCFADLGNEVTCVDIDSRKVEKLKTGEPTIHEPGLEELLKDNVKRGNIRFTTDIGSAVKQAEAIFICVGTPERSDGSADLQYVDNVAREIGKNIDQYAVIINKSTVPVGTTKRVRRIISEELKARGADVEFDVISNPEFLKEGAAIEDFMKPDRVVIGTDSDRVRPVVDRLYDTVLRTGKPVIYMSEPAAELVKYGSNAMLATRISFMNQLTDICEIYGADIREVQKGIASDSRIGPAFLHAGAGYGGSCFPKDVNALAIMLEEHGLDSSLIRAADYVNDRQKRSVVRRLKKHIPNLEDKVIGIWGLAFKPGTDDMREATSKVVIEQLAKEYATVQAFDPVAMENAKREIKEPVIYAKSADEAATGADALVVLTEWNQFRNPDFKHLKGMMRGNVIVDGRNLYNPNDLKELGFVYQGIGR